VKKKATDHDSESNVVGKGEKETAKNRKIRKE
jgi:hypothetical protein